MNTSPYKSVSNTDAAQQTATSSTGPKWETLIAEAFAAAFPPRQSSILELDLKSLVFAREGGGPLFFSGTAKRSAGGIARNIAMGSVEVQGTIDANNKVTFTKPAGNSGQGVASL
ncbi:MAG: hypothetical protein ACAI38_23870 [Myxococcota bacterium]|nr:hypothetical protein [Myxococcota bacterium]